MLSGQPGGPRMYPRSGYFLVITIVLLPYRFPRVKQIRHDKIWSDCMTSTDLAALTAPNQGKLTKRFLDTDESAEPQCKVI